MNKTHHAIVVGITAYPGFSNLQGPDADAEAFRDWLIDPAGGDVDPGNVSFLRTVDFHPPGPSGVNDARPLSDEIRRLFQPYVRDGLLNPWIGDRLYIYMAGHGFSVSEPTKARLTALYAANAEISLAPAVVGTIFAEWFRLNAVFREIVLIMDCCRTNNPLHTLGEPALPSTQGRAGLSSRVRKFYAYATQWGQAARERQMNGGVQGIFTTTLLQGLHRARPNRLGRVTGTIVRNYVHQNIDDVAGQTRIEPPDFEVDEDRDIVFINRPTAPGSPVRIRLDPFTGQEELVVRISPEEEVARLQPASCVHELLLPPGFYKASVETTTRHHLFEVGGGHVEFTL